VRISIVTPSYQQGHFIERTLQSVAVQNRGALRGEIQHIVVDGGSTDGTQGILARWSDRVTWSSERDSGQTAAINAGLSRATAEILGYLNSDDIYYDGAIEAALEAFDRNPSADVVYGRADIIDTDDHVLADYPTEEWSLERLKEMCFLCQPAVFFRRRILDRGMFDPAFDHCMDYEFWLRAALHGARFVHVPRKLAASRTHAATKTVRATEKVHREINDMLKKHVGAVPESWLTNYAYSMLDARGEHRAETRGYLANVAILTIGAALRWNGRASIPLLRTLAGNIVRGTGVIPQRGAS